MFLKKPPPALTASLGTSALKSAEWMAENAYIAPGFHRLLTAGGLSLGLWAGRQGMDIITARNASTGEETAPEQVPQLLHPLHGLMRYNPYSDAASDRWKFVADRFTPLATGALGTYYGGKVFFNKNMPNGEPFSAASTNLRKQWGSNNHSTEVADGMLGLARSDAKRRFAAALFGEGSSTGQHLFGALWPLNNGLIAESFREGAGRTILLPFSNLSAIQKVNQFLGNHGSTSRNLYASARDTTKWMETNVLRYDRAEEWAHPELLLHRAKDGLQKFHARTPADEEKLARTFRSIIDEAYQHKRSISHLSEAAQGHALNQFISGAAHGRETRGLVGAAYDHLLHDIGMDLRESTFAQGPLTFFARLLGSHKHEKEVITQYAQHLKTNFYHDLKVEPWVEAQLKMTPWKVAAAYGGVAAIFAAGLAGASIVGAKIHKEAEHTHKPHIYEPPQPPAPSTETPEKKPQEHKAKGLADWVNGKPLDVAHWVSRVLITPPSMHRFMNAAYLSAMLYGGMRVSNILTGRKLSKLMSGGVNAAGIAESALQKSDVWVPLRPLHGLLAYTPNSAEISDRWRQAAHYIMPVGVGMLGTYAGSSLYFREREKSLEAPKTLEDFADRISFEQSKAYGAATAITSIFNTGSGIHLLPVFNYSSNLHNRYLMGSGQQVALPGLGKWWSGNAGTTPWGVKLTLTQMSNYLTFNDVARPRELPTLVHSLIGKLYPTLNERDLLDAKQVMIDRIHDVRDSYLVEGHIPHKKQAALGVAMKQLLSGQGFEMLLQEAGLDPTKANLSANGASGNIANFLHSKKTVEALTRDYRQQFASRSEYHEKPKDYLRTLIDQGTSTRATANDNPAPKSFADRSKTRERSGAALGG